MEPWKPVGHLSIETGSNNRSVSWTRYRPDGQPEKLTTAIPHGWQRAVASRFRGPSSQWASFLEAWKKLCFPQRLRTS